MSETSDDRLSFCLDRMRDRAQDVLNIDLQKLSKRSRIETLQTLRKQLAEKRREEFLERLKRFSSYNARHIDNNYSGNNSQDYNNSSDSEDSSALSVMFNSRYFSIKSFVSKNITSILVWPDFIIATDTHIREEATALCNSLVCVRPEGHRVLVLVDNFCAIEFSKNGKIRRRFKVHFTRGPTILDCVLLDYNKKLEVKDLHYYVSDILMYNGCLLASSEAACRIFIMRSRLEEAYISRPIGEPIFTPLEYKECTRESMIDAYYSMNDLEHEKDSLVFVDKNAGYIGGYNPNWLCWRDGNTSKYASTCEVRAKVIVEGSFLKTLDDVIIGSVPDGVNLEDSDIATIRIHDVNLKDTKITSFQICEQTLTRGHKARRVADPMRKIIRAWLNTKTNPEFSFNRLIDTVSTFSNKF
ncbi:conserved hypothetical protein [Theileria equi strain WA]|uniref:Snurportin-1 n=1 Tax=Theileria equi strain WA TaxID=1537102 RepID=L1LG96_THEEQ|nr:conserved hypothetical protein [Theileria equi strain WA]EKX74284.1 conserved hypothetical protein [Theileria equi strain WA]|eukprot:XP_004833736.1 conserved hypothetical protein [Theileria equi strain WA]